MKFEVKVKETDQKQADGFLERFTRESVEEYNKQMKKIPGIVKDKIPIPKFDTGYFYDKERKIFIVWNTFPSPKLPGRMNLLNPFRKSIKEMEKNLQDFLQDSGIKSANVKFIE